MGTHETKMSSQLSTVAKFHHALDLLAESSPPHQPGLVMRMSELCHDLKQGGAALEEAGAELDTLQARLVQVCQQSGLDLELRLQILELVELRAFGWRSTAAWSSSTRRSSARHGLPRLASSKRGTQAA